MAVNYCQRIDMKKLLLTLLAISLPVFAEMIDVEGGSFSMGSATGAYDEKPVHSVNINSFQIGKYEVTQGEWVSVMGNNPNIAGDLNLPVETVSWYQILIYCNKLSISESLKPCYSINGSTNPDTWGSVPENSSSEWNLATCDFTANGYRLPTEAEWEFAARGGNNTVFRKYSGSNYADEVAWYNLNSGMTTHIVGSKQPNELGLYDMSGNVWEFTWDWYGSYSVPDQSNPTGPASGTNRVLRGGSWGGYDYWCSVSYRNGNYPYMGRPYDGFRPVRSKGLNGLNNDALKSNISLVSNYPNPFNPATTICFATTNAGVVKVEILNQSGQMISILHNGKLTAGNHSLQWHANDVSAGTYFARVSQNGKSVLARMLLVK